MVEFFIEYLKKYKNWCIYALFCAVLTFVSFIHGLPAPSEDDVFWASAPIEWAKTGHLYAPELKRVLDGFHSHDRFLLIPPFYPLVLGAWIKMAGVSAKSFLFFQNFWFFTTMLGFVGYLAWFQVSWLGRYVGALAVMGYLLSCGLRPEPFALTLMFIGLNILACSRQSFIKHMVAFLFIGLACMAIPNPIPLATGLTACIIILRVQNDVEPKHWKSWFNPMIFGLLTAFIITALLFAQMIGWDFQAACEQIASATHGAEVPRSKAIYFLCWYLKQFWRPLTDLPIFICLIITCISCFWIRNEHKHLKILIWGSGATVLLTLFFRPAMISLLLFTPWVGLVAFISAITENNHFKRLCGYGGLIALLGLHHLLLLITFASTDKPSEPYFHHIKQEVISQCNGKNLVIDDYAARYLFDFRFPSNTYSLFYLKPYPNHSLTPHSKIKGDFWIVSRWRLGHYIPEYMPDFPRLHFFGRQFNSLPENPYEFVILP